MPAIFANFQVVSEDCPNLNNHTHLSENKEESGVQSPKGVVNQPVIEQIQRAIEQPLINSDNPDTNLLHNTQDGNVALTSLHSEVKKHLDDSEKPCCF
jgi:hypothetical protein